MNDKTLVKAKFSSFNPFAVLCFAIAGIVLIACFMVASAIGGSPMWAIEGMDYGYYWFFIGAFIFVALGLMFMAMRFELIVCLIIAVHQGFYC